MSADYDSVIFNCSCGYGMEMQSRCGPFRVMARYDPAEVPPGIAKDLKGKTVTCSLCGKRWMLQSDYRYTVTMRKQEIAEARNKGGRMNCFGPTKFLGKCVRGRDAKIISCVPCGFKHLHPKPTEEELREYYKQEYFGKEKSDYSAEHNTIDPYWQMVYWEQCEALGSWSNLRKPMWKLLDVGCGRDPVFLRYALKHGQAAPSCSTGMDPSLEEKTDLVCTSWEEVDQRGHDWNLVNLGFVLEHAANPCEVLYNCWSRLELGGRLLVEVPFDYNPVQAHRPSGMPPWWVSTPDHINYFTPESLKGLLRRCGFWCKLERTTYPVELLKLHGYDYSTDSSVGPQLNERRSHLQEFWRDSGMSQQTTIGRTVWIIAEKIA